MDVALIFAMATLLQRLDSTTSTVWSYLNNTFFPGNPRLQFTVLTSLVHVTAVYSAAAFFLSLKQFGCLERFRIQGDKEPDKNLVRKCQVHMIISCIISFPAVMHFVVWPLARRSASEIETVPSALSIVSHLIMFIVCEDCLFYWLHRASHHPSVYAIVHKQHHEFKINHPLCYEYSTIWEGLFVNTGWSLSPCWCSKISVHLFACFLCSFDPLRACILTIAHIHFLYLAVSSHNWDRWCA